MVAMVGVAITPEGVAGNVKGEGRKVYVGRRRYSAPKGEDTKLAMARDLIPGVLALVAR